MQDLGIFGLEGSFFLRTPVRVLWQGISSSISFALTIIYPKIVLWQLLGLAKLPRTQAFHVHKALEIIVVCKHENFIFAAF